MGSVKPKPTGRIVFGRGMSLRNGQDGEAPGGTRRRRGSPKTVERTQALQGRNVVVTFLGCVAA
jgi:hypothetical protein